MNINATVLRSQSVVSEHAVLWNMKLCR